MRALVPKLWYARH